VTGIQPEAVIFDMDGVLCAYDLRVRLDILAGHAATSRAAVHAAIWGSGFEDDADAGHYPSAAAYLEAFAQRLGAPLTRAQWVAARKAAMTPKPAMLSLVRSLAATRPVAMLTNNGPATEDAFADLFPEAAALFGERAFFSWRFATKKPDVVIYHALAARLGVGASACVFIDDKARNVEGARAAGMQAVRFTGEAALLDDLARIGLAP
jgi:putative hydrolase of the HAD superfamily